MKQVRSLVVLATLCCVGLPTQAQPKPGEEPGWAKGRPKTDVAMKMAPVPAFPIPTAPDKLPTDVGKRFYKDYMEAYKAEPIGWAMYAYQSAIVALEAIKRAGKKER